MTRLVLVRHAKASAGWVQADPGLDEIGRAQAAALADVLGPSGPLAIVASPLRRARETAAALEARWGSAARVEPGVGEVPSPDGYGLGERTEWLRAAMAGTWAPLGPRYDAWRRGVLAALAAVDHDAVVVSHFIAINVAIGAAVGDDRIVVAALDNCSRTVIDVDGGRFRLVEVGAEAPETLVL